MLLRSQKARWSCFVPVSLLALTSALLFFSLERMKREPSFGVGVTCVLMAGLLLMVLADANVASERGPHVRVRTPFGVRELDAKTAVVSVKTSHGTRSGVRYEVIMADASGQRATLAELWTKRGAERARARLADTFERLDGNRERERVRSGLAEERAEVDAQQAAAMAEVKKYYESGTHKKTIVVMCALLVVYVVGMAVYIYATGGTL